MCEFTVIHAETILSSADIHYHQYECSLGTEPMTLVFLALALLTEQRQLCLCKEEMYLII